MGTLCPRPDVRFRKCPLEKDLTRRRPAGVMRRLRSSGQGGKLQHCDRSYLITARPGLLLRLLGVTGFVI